MPIPRIGLEPGGFCYVVLLDDKCTGRVHCPLGQSNAFLGPVQLEMRAVRVVYRGCCEVRLVSAVTGGRRELG